MKLDIEWKRPLTLSDAADNGLIFSFDSGKVEPAPGIYIFGRIHGKSFEALYVGKADDLQKRTKSQLKNHSNSCCTSKELKRGLKLL